MPDPHSILDNCPGFSTGLCTWQVYPSATLFHALAIFLLFSARCRRLEWPTPSLSIPVILTFHLKLQFSFPLGTDQLLSMPQHKPQWSATSTSPFYNRFTLKVLASTNPSRTMAWDLQTYTIQEARDFSPTLVISTPHSLSLIVMPITKNLIGKWDKMLQKLLFKTKQEKKRFLKCIAQWFKFQSQFLNYNGMLYSGCQRYLLHLNRQ